MKKPTLLLDADILAYQAAAGAESQIDWDGGAASVIPASKSCGPDQIGWLKSDSWVVLTV